MKKSPQPPGFRLFLLARTVSWAGSAMTMVALPVLLYQRTGDAALTGLLTALEAVPYLVLGLFAGALVDRWDQRRTLILTSWLSAAMMASIPAAAAAHALSTPQLLLAAVATSSLFVFFDAAGFGVVPALVGPAGIAAATSTMMSINTIIGLIGPVIGAAVATGLGPPTALGIDAASYAAAAVVLTRLTWHTATPPTARPSTGSQIVEGLRYIRSQPVIRTLTYLGVGNSLTAGAVTGLVVVVAVTQIGLGSHDPRIGLLYAAAAAGSLAAAQLLPALQAHLSIGRITTTALAVNAAALLLWANSSGVILGLLALAIWQGSNTAVSLNGIIVRQAITPQQLQGRVNTTARMIAWGGQPLGAGIGGVLASHLGTTSALLLTGAGVGTSLLFGITSRRHTDLHLADLLPNTSQTR